MSRSPTDPQTEKWGKELPLRAIWELISLTGSCYHNNTQLFTSFTGVRDKYNVKNNVALLYGPSSDKLLKNRAN